MNIKADWNEIRKHFTKCFRSNFFVSIASVDEENCPTVTPIGSLFLGHHQDGYYFEKYLSRLPEHAKHNKKICVMAVNSSIWFWLKSLFQGGFSSNPAIRLFGELGERREATEAEKTRLRARVRSTRGLKGNHYLWDDMQYVRDVTFTKAEKVNLGAMTRN